uniref:Mini-chromosome maintenance complex-binding protein n=1 Tax=Kalanchoe fedtschenkoi TaxID=63787 RepID=A0A7N0UFD7_KALFE
MVGLQYDCLANPLGAVRLSFEKAVASGDGQAALQGKDWGTGQIFADFISENLSQIPIINQECSQRLRPNTLVRFRGMVQDALGSEFYIGAFKDGSVWRTNKYLDASQCHTQFDCSDYDIASSPDIRIWERRLIYCVPVPCYNSWSECSLEGETNSCIDSTSHSKEKRFREDSETVDSMVCDGDECPSAAKKMREDGHLSPTHAAGFSARSLDSGTSMLMNPRQSLLPCLVKTYDILESEVKLNDIVEFVGILSYEAESSENADEMIDEVASVHLPPGTVPRLHCISHRRLEVHDLIHSSVVMEPKSSLVRQIREDLLRHLTSILGNDGLTAHYLLLHLLSKVQARLDDVAVGKFSLNLTCFSKETMSAFGSQLSHAINSLVPLSHCMPLTVEYLNSASLAPKKDYETNRLCTGILQLANGSHLTIDETKLEAGTLNSVGVENVRLLKNLVEVQKVEYDFQFYKVEMQTDVQMLILSEGKSNIIPADVVVPFQPGLVNPMLHVISDELNAWRWYLATLRSSSHSIAPEVQKVVEDDLVSARQADRNLGTEDFSRCLTMGRLIAISFGEDSLSLEHWQMVKELERLRKERIK